ncbi:MAG: hypothetical protein ACRD7E_16775, partial [Bryobacteraceae bacterium]
MGSSLLCNDSAPSEKLNVSIGVIENFYWIPHELEGYYGVRLNSTIKLLEWEKALACLAPG